MASVPKLKAVKSNKRVACGLEKLGFEVTG